MSTIDNVTAKISKSKRWMILSRAKRMLDYFNYHNENLNAGQWHAVITLEDGIDDEDLELIRDSVEFLYTHSVKLTKEQWYYVSDMYMDFFSSDGEFYEPGYVSDVNSSRKIGKKRPVNASEGTSRNTKSWMSKARDCGYSMDDLKYWFEVETGRNFDRESDGRFFTEWVTKFLSNCDDVKSCDSVMSSYNPYGTDFKWYDEPIVIYIDGENITFRKYTGDYKGNIVVVQPEYNERTNVLSWVVYLNNRKLEAFETSYDALDFAQFELVDRYITPIRSSRKIVSAIDLRRKQDFVDAYMAAYGVTKTEAFKAFKDCVNRGDESYIDEIIRGFKGNSRKSFYED